MKTGKCTKSWGNDMMIQMEVGYLSGPLSHKGMDRMRREKPCSSLTRWWSSCGAMLPSIGDQENGAIVRYPEMVVHDERDR